MNALIEVFRMTEISPETRARIIIQLGRCINDEHGMNLTEAIVYELVTQLEPNNETIKQPHYTKHLKQ